MSAAPPISFLVLAYNTEAYIADCLDAILGQEGNFDFEVVVIDDASTDGTLDVVSRYADPRIRVIRHERNTGAWKTVNDGFAAVRGRYIARIDSDDRHRSDFLARTVPILEADPHVGMVYGDIAMINARGQITCPGNLVQPQRGQAPPTRRELVPLMKRNYVPSPTVIARREAWQCGLPLPEGRNFNDWHLTLHMAMRWDFHFVDAVLADYRIHDSNMHRDMIRTRMGEEVTWALLADIFRKHDFGTTSGAIRRDVTASQALQLGDKYFGGAMWSDAARSYRRAIGNRYSLAGNPRVLWRWMRAEARQRVVT